ncbi:hypothetical protein L6272_06475, partial [Microgenomates group bacterium]|nr:hypothetical protein [Microgenomates group bacterium]
MSQVSKQAVGSGEADGDGEGLGLPEGEGDGEADGLGDGLGLAEGDGEGEAVTVKLSSQTFSGTTCCTGGSWGVGLG